MKSANQTAIRQAFTQQARAFENGRLHFSKRDYLEYMAERVAPGKGDSVLEVAAEDEIERLRDASHVRNLSRAELQGLYHGCGMTVRCCETTAMPTNLQHWLDHTATAPSVQAEIKARLEEELRGGAKTGFAPYCRDGELWFDQRWTLLIGAAE